jgi:hypothetical protein
VPDLIAEHGYDLNDVSCMFKDASAAQAAAAEDFLFLCGKTVTVRSNGAYGSTILDYRETLPPDLGPVLVLDASSRPVVRETYNLWGARGGIKRLAEASKDYSPLTIHLLDAGGGKGAFKDSSKRHLLLEEIAATINSNPAAKWLVIHHKDEDFETDLGALLASDNTDVAFLNWGRHDATNLYADRPNIILAGTLFLRPDQYEAIGRAAAGLHSSDGPFPEDIFEAVRRGEHRHFILQAACRGAIRRCVGNKCPPADLYIIASRRSHIGDDLPNVFPGARIVKWQPVRKPLAGKVGMAVQFIAEQTRDGAFVSNAEVMDHIAVKDKRYYHRHIKGHPDFQAAIARLDIEVCRQGRRTGYQKTFNLLFGNLQENDSNDHYSCTGNPGSQGI